jgi:alpha/beta superfamily hydrolase
MKTEHVEFAGTSGARLSGLLDLPEGKPTAYALFAHCFTCSKNLKIISNIAREMTDEGFALLRFDFTGLGKSEGDFAETTFTTNLGDLEAAAGFLEREHAAPRAIIGHSLGGAAVLAVAGRIESVRCVATIAAPADPLHVRQLVEGAEFDERGRASVSIGGRQFQIGRDFVEDLEQHDLLDDVAAMKCPLLIFHGVTDTVVGIENAERLYKAARHPKSFVSLGHADHMVSNPHDADFIGHVLSAWASRYVQDD